MPVGSPLTHQALWYATRTEFLAATVPFVRDGLTAREPVLVALPTERLAWLRPALGGDADQADLRDMRVVGRNPAGILPMLLAFQARWPDRSVRMLGELVWPDRSVLAYPVCAKQETLLNVALADRAASVLCPYHTAELPAHWLADARRNHPRQATGGAPVDNTEYADPLVEADRYNLPLPTPPGEARWVPVRADTVPVIRQLVRDLADAAGLSPARTVDLVIAVNELATNTVRHSPGAGVLAVWTSAAEVTCQLSDAGYLADPLIGQIPPPVGQLGGRGLVLVNQLCDLVRTYTRPGLTTIRVGLRG